MGNDDIRMENTALNGTTATKDQEDWKKKKGSGRIVAASLALLLGLSFYAGRQVGGANLREMGMTNAAAPSSSMSLVGSGTAASDLKTLTLAIDDDEVIERGIFFEMPWLGSGGGNAGDKCKKTSDCKIPDGLNHAVCRKGKCQRGVCRDYCGVDSDCLSGFECGGKGKDAKCHSPASCNGYYSDCCFFKY